MCYTGYFFIPFGTLYPFGMYKVYQKYIYLSSPFAIFQSKVNVNYILKTSIMHDAQYTRRDRDRVYFIERYVLSSMF